MNTNYKLKQSTLMIANDVIWLIDDISLARGGVASLVQKYIHQYPFGNYTLSIYDTLTSETIEIDCPLQEMPQITEYIYHLEKASPLTFISTNSLSNSYVVGMSLHRGRITFGTYIAEEEKLRQLQL